MESFLVDISAEGVASSNGSGRTVLDEIRHGMISESDVFQTILRDLGQDVGGSGSIPVGEAEWTADRLDGTGAAWVLDSTIAAAGSGETSARQRAALAMVSQAGNESRGEEPWTLTAAATAPVSEAPTPAARTTEQPTDDSRDVAFDETAAGLVLPLLEFATFTAAGGHLVPRQTISSGDGTIVIDQTAAQPRDAVQNREHEGLPAPGLREEASARTLRPFIQSVAGLQDHAGQPGADLQVQAVDLSGSVRVPGDLDLQAQPGHVLEGNGSKVQGPAGQNHQVDGLGFAPDRVATTEAADSASRQGDGGTSHEPPAREHEGREFAGMPKNEAAVRSHSTGHGIPLEPLVPRTPSASSSGVTPSDQGLDPASMRADRTPQHADGFGASGGTKTVHAVQVNLDQEELGRLRVRVVLADSTVHTRVTTEYADLGQFLMDRRDHLESALHASGLDVGQFKVHIDRQGSGQSADDWMTRSFGDEFDRPRGRHEPMRADADATPVAEPHGLSVFA